MAQLMLVPQRGIVVATVVMAMAAVATLSALAPLLEKKKLIMRTPRMKLLGHGHQFLLRVACTHMAWKTVPEEATMMAPQFGVTLEVKEKCHTGRAKMHLPNQVPQVPMVKMLPRRLEQLRRGCFHLVLE